ncbi:MAG: hypothetical protein IJ224_09520 [Lachnospiraceae bacterium]|nr:hypothetical protein [Lachnospiraceae bacterium]
MKNKNNSILYSAIVIVIVLISVISGKVGGTKDNNDTTTETKTTEVITTETTTETVTKTEATTKEEKTEAATEEVRTEITEITDERPLTFRNANRLNEHYEKHGIEMGFSSAEEYEAAAKKVVLNKDSLHKLEEEDGDDVYYLEISNEFVVVSPDGYIRTYFNPSDGIDYYNRQ